MHNRLLLLGIVFLILLSVTVTSVVYTEKYLYNSTNAQINETFNTTITRNLSLRKDYVPTNFTIDLDGNRVIANNSPTTYTSYTSTAYKQQFTSTFNGTLTAISVMASASVDEGGTCGNVNIEFWNISNINLTGSTGSCPGNASYSCIKQWVNTNDTYPDGFPRYGTGGKWIKFEFNDTSNENLTLESDRKYVLQFHPTECTDGGDDTLKWVIQERYIDAAGISPAGYEDRYTPSLKVYVDSIENISIKIGDTDVHSSGDLNSSIGNLYLDETYVDNYLNTCTAYTENLCYVPIVFNTTKMPATSGRDGSNEFSVVYSDIKMMYELPYIDNCSGDGINSLNVSLLNESDDSVVNGTMEFWFSYNVTYSYQNYSVSVTADNATFCIYPNSTTITTDILIDYTIGGVSFNYYVTGLELTSTSQLLNLYSTSSATRVTFTVTDLYDDPIDGAYIKILKYDVGNNTYRTVEVLKTNNDGEAIGNIVLYTEWYKFIIEYQGTTYLTTDPYKMFGTTKTFRIDLTADDWFADYDTTQGVSTTLNFTNSTKNFVYIWNDPSGAMQYGCLKVIQRNITQESEVCNSCVESTASTILCNIGSDTAVYGKRYIAMGYLEFDGKKYQTDILEIKFEGGDFEPLYQKGAEEKEFGVFLSFIIILALTLIGIWNPVTAIIMNIVGFALVSALGFLSLKTPMLIAFIVLGIITLYKVGRKR